ncbi:C-C motif chemokine 3-like [Rhinolophus ferrumequinum]|uniref:C-C motif chemokine n=1 Tax=Rhinolophus ferrumequinum TaxID=59479 RepID=A0A671E3Q2_RHIFE|nr:C-C motif chemokine 3-like [Rhinolophus ferrumequinum]
MKVLGATVLALLCTVALCSYIRDKIYTVPTCCFSYMSQKIPRKFVVAYFKTSSQCSKDAIIFLTRKGRHLCADPSDAWVQEYISNTKENSQVDQRLSAPVGIKTPNKGMPTITPEVPSPMSPSPFR